MSDAQRLHTSHKIVAEPASWAENPLFWYTPGTALRLSVIVQSLHTQPDFHDKFKSMDELMKTVTSDLWEGLDMEIRDFIAYGWFDMRLPPSLAPDFNNWDSTPIDMREVNCIHNIMNAYSSWMMARVHLRKFIADGRFEDSLEAQSHHRAAIDTIRAWCTWQVDAAEATQWVEEIDNYLAVRVYDRIESNRRLSNAFK